ncbi:MAG: hypothetical protein B6U97_01115 [Candidatus Altiarchaeales archaeon ex4484_96]|nr:MAG: hypothetical protein B6U97_01115 [Candidatus Altiarchaeales archaeon ex4484_96]
MDSLNRIMDEGDCFSCLVESPKERMRKDLFNTVNTVAGHGELVYVTTNEPYSTVADNLLALNINTRGIYYIDCISAISEGLDSVDVSFILDISDLNSLSIMVKKQLDRVKDGGFLFLDAVHTLWIYNKSSIVARFTQATVEKAQKAGVNVIFFIVDVKNKDLLRKIAPLFDYFIVSGDALNG